MAAPSEKAGISVATATEVTAEGATLSTTTTTADTLAPSPARSIAPSQMGDRRSSDLSTPATAHNDLNPFDTDLEAMVSTRTIAVPGDDSCGMKSTSNSNLKGSPDGQVWPGQAHWKKKAKAAKINNRSCQQIARLSKRNRILAKILIGALVVGIAVAVGLGVSKSLGAGIWKPGN